ncbi:hypothetical protein J6590_022328 [Homalodisca vitripennis]|nr:hypothetical protein J6590_022328 [Homalodisca vitripennis]
MAVGVGGVCSLTSEGLVNLNKGVPPPASSAKRKYGLKIRRGPRNQESAVHADNGKHSDKVFRDQPKRFFRHKFVQKDKLRCGQIETPEQLQARRIHNEEM